MLANGFKSKFVQSIAVNGIQKRSIIYNPEIYADPVINKNELDSIESQDARHFKKIRSPISRESNALTYNPKIHKFTNMIMREGKAYTARNVVDKTIYKIKLKQVEKFNKADSSSSSSKNNADQIETNPVKIMLKAIDNCKPILKLTPVKKGGITYQVPVPLSEKEREFKSYKFILNACEDKSPKMRMYDRLANEIIEAFNYQGKAIKSKIELHKMAESNRAYAHYRWI